MMQRIALIICIYLHSVSACANWWQDLWHSKNSQAQQMYNQQKFKQAAQTFQDPAWQATASYRAGDYQTAAKLFKELPTADDAYNLGNALAKLGNYQAAVDAYTKALAANPEHVDARFNKELIEKLLQKQAKNPQKPSQQPNPEANNKGSKAGDNKPKAAPDKTPSNKQQKSEQSEQKPGSQNAQSQPDKAKAQNATQQQKIQQQQMNQQWLKLIPDDPGGLLREKFRRDYLRSRGELE